MRFAFLPLLLCSCAHQPAAPAFRLSAAAGAPLVLLSTDGPLTNRVRVFFRWPDEANIWFAEWTTNLTEWHRAQNETILPEGLRYTEGDAWGNDRLWRVRRAP